LIGSGLKNKDIAVRLSISDITVRHHLTSIFRKLEVSDRQKLLILAYRFGLAELASSAEPA
jgi:DNA-binding NarL/FixJ family response regulator